MVTFHTNTVGATHGYGVVLDNIVSSVIFVYVNPAAATPGYYVVVDVVAVAIHVNVVRIVIFDNIIMNAVTNSPLPEFNAIAIIVDNPVVRDFVAPLRFIINPDAMPVTVCDLEAVDLDLAGGN